ncbi:MAG TPA: hypothetical protein VED17_03585 [Nitrososphaerales archaeon]|nr:hypothetical protein [Nitrososphaerales archaeon]
MYFIEYKSYPRQYEPHRRDIDYGTYLLVNNCGAYFFAAGSQLLFAQSIHHDVHRDYDHRRFLSGNLPLLPAGGQLATTSTLIVGSEVP